MMKSARKRRRQNATNVTVDGVAVTNDVSRPYFPTIGLGELVRNAASRSRTRDEQRLHVFAACH